MKNGKASWCAICEVKSHARTDFHLNLKNRQNYQAVYQINVVAQNNDNNQRSNAQNEQNNQRYEGCRYERRFDNMEVEVNSLGIETTDHIGPSNVSHVTRKDTDMQTVHTRTGLT